MELSSFREAANCAYTKELADRGTGQPNFSLRHRIQFSTEVNQPPIRLVPWALSPGVQRPLREADHSSPPIEDVKNVCNYTSTPPHVFRFRCLIKHRDTFTFTRNF
jgi:hypothetical protein